MGMAASDAEKRAMKKYAQTEKGKEARKEAVNRYQDTEDGREKLEAAKG
jgi:DNA-binding PadR family transcriptional regulator